ncbi:MAG: S1 RNA-binding domain-containing protein, partial [bacterium]
DILGDEDHLGDMDFKVAGTADGITALQMDIKIHGVTKEIMRQALSQARDGRLHILNVMNETLNTARDDISTHAPRIHSLKIRQDKIRDIIGPGGKVIRGIVEETGCKIDIQDDGTVLIASSEAASMKRAIEIIEGITMEAQVGKIYKGRVVRIVDFGAFVEIMPGTDGLLHISQIGPGRVQRVQDVLKEGDEINVKVLEIDRSGKIRLSRKEAMGDAEKAEQPADRSSS